MAIEQGEIVLIPVPFTDLSSQKRRPVIVLSGTQYNQSMPDVIVVAMTSNASASRFAFRITSADLTSGKLNRPGYVRADKVYTLAQSIIVKRFGRVSGSVLSRIHGLLAEITSDTSPSG